MCICIKYRLPSLNRIIVIPERNLEDHKMKDHFTKLKSIRRHKNYSVSNEGSVMSHGRHDQTPALWQNLYEDNNKNNNNNDDDDNEVVTTPASITATSDSSVSTSLDLSQSQSHPSTTTTPLKQWRKCCVCNEDTTWVNILKVS